MNKTKMIMLLVTCSSITNASYRALSGEEEAGRQASMGMTYGKDITLENNSDYGLTVVIKDDATTNTTYTISPHASQSIRVQPKQEVHITTNVDGRTFKNNFKRHTPSENFWEISVKTGIIGGIRITKRSSILH